MFYVIVTYLATIAIDNLRGEVLCMYVTIIHVRKHYIDSMKDGERLPLVVEK